MNRHPDVSGNGSRTAYTGLAQLSRARARIAARVVGRERELELILAAVAAGRDMLIEGPPGTSKSALLRAITAEWGVPLVFVEGNADLTPARLIGHHNGASAIPTATTGCAPTTRPARPTRIPSSTQW